ncbi:hypothetical protein TWF696_007812 [Orbilia brochopaga]|uniref:Enoyl reductase (ER) domain-containing protein n=1 Tax=Orbilia brochopaga TaxID=3140254 RepID=A0AAV9UPQ2_9PEZI
MSYTAKQWMVKEQTGDHLDIDKTFELVTKQLNVGDLKEGEVIAKITYISNDPAQRAWIHKKNIERRLYRPPIRDGEPMEAFGVSEIVESRNPEYQKGDQVFGNIFWADYCILPVGSIVMKVPGDPTDIITLGISGLAAYFGLMNVGAVTPKDQTIVVSSAAGSTGSITCQIAKNILGIKHVVGVAGSDAKCERLTKEFGCDVALNYKSPTFKQDFEAATPDDIDVFMDNTAGEVTDLALMRMKDFGRVVISGAISYYDEYDKKGDISRGSWMQIICHKIRIEGFIVFQFAEQFAKALGDLGLWAQEGKVKLVKQVWDAKVEDVPKGMQKLLRGENTGKLITKLVAGR